MIELIDESVREGDARGFHPQTAESRMALLRLTQEICNIDEFSLGWAAISPIDQETLHAFLAARRRGEIKRTSRALVFDLFQISRQLSSLLAQLEAVDREAIVLGLGVVASNQIAPHLDGPWLAQHDATPPHDTDTLHARLAIQAGERLKALRRAGCGQVGLIIQDAFRAPLSSTLQYVEQAVDAGADFVRVNDSVGSSTPDQVRERVSALMKRFPGQRFIGHFHNDLGMATANAIAAAQAGIPALDVTVNGVGNRAGNPSVVEVATALRVALNTILPGVRYERFMELARAGERHFCLPLSPHAPVTGFMAHADEASIRTHMIESIEGETWLPYDPALVGGVTEAIHTQTSGRGTAAQTLSRSAPELAARGITLDDALIDRAYAWIRDQMTARAVTWRPVAWRAHEEYVEALRRSYVSDDDLIDATIGTRGLFNPAEH